MSYSRFAVYYVPSDDALADFGAAWLGWDIRTGHDALRFDVNGLRDITMTPMKYGFHGTLKPPFRLVEGHSITQLADAAQTLAARLAPAACEGLALTALGGFLALTPVGDAPELRRVAQACVQDLDPFRAPASEAELARRRKAGLTPRQDAHLLKWGYPYVMEDFRFHLTLSGRLPAEALTHWSSVAEKHLPALPAPFKLDQIALCGERKDGRFELIHRYDLTG